MNVLSLFSGIGGLDLGLERAGMTIVGQVEIDPWCRKVLAKHWPEVPRHDDVRTAMEWWGGRRTPDLVAGGFPCQPVSLAGKGLAQADSRWLWPSFAGIIRALRPRYVLVENVPGLLGRGMGDVLGDLASIGYDAEWDCVPAAFVGAPHIRNRVWVIAYPDSRRLPEQQECDREQVTGIESSLGNDALGLRRAVANPAGDRRPREGQRPAPGHPNGSGHLRRVWPSAHALADAEGERRRAFRPDGATQARADAQPGHAGERYGASAWATEPDVGRVAYGVPDRLDRLRGLGNAVVPQVAEHIGRLIMTTAAA